jgi:hypothetical protein
VRCGGRLSPFVLFVSFPSVSCQVEQGALPSLEHIVRALPFFCACPPPLRHRPFPPLPSQALQPPASLTLNVLASIHPPSSLYSLPFQVSLPSPSIPSTFSSPFTFRNLDLPPITPCASREVAVLTPRGGGSCSDRVVVQDFGPLPQPIFHSRGRCGTTCGRTLTIEISNADERSSDESRASKITSPSGWLSTTCTLSSASMAGYDSQMQGTHVLTQC